MNGKESSSYSHYQISRKHENYLILDIFSFTVKLWKSVKMINFECKLDLQVFSWSMEQN